ncbi:MAG: hypothetical protein GXP29_14030 [Planctomycetes bacterium]|nr:hypothetical protein [Planctomycetota bacterium]
MATTPSKQQSAPAAFISTCPSCGETGGRVSRVTLENLLSPDLRSDIGEDQYRVCTTLRCDTVYFAEAGGRMFRKSDLSVRFGLKETDAPRHICYCFDHTIEAIHDEIGRNGESTVLEKIKSEMKRVGCQCERTNPLGSCCLSTVREVVKNELQNCGRVGTTSAAQLESDCCSNSPCKQRDDDHCRRDMVKVGRSFWFYWGLPIVVFLLATRLSPEPRTFVWAGALIWAGIGCFINSRRCGRLHCHITGPLWGVGGVAVMLYGFGIAPIPGSWIAIGIVVVTIAAFSLEWIGGNKYLTTGCEEKTFGDNKNSCCTPEASTGPAGAVATDRAGLWAAGGSVFAAAFASACCWLPLVLIAFGASAAGVAGFFEAYRLHFVVVAIGLLGLGFYVVYFRKSKCEPGFDCAIPNRKLDLFNRAMLWVATVLVGAFVMFPNYVGMVLGQSGEISSVVDHSGLVSDTYRVEGMTCEGCSGILRTALMKLPDVRAATVDYATKSAVIQYDKVNPVSEDLVIEAIKGAGYSATHIRTTP